MTISHSVFDQTSDAHDENYELLNILCEQPQPTFFTLTTIQAT
jgi:hypothetical protein